MNAFQEEDYTKQFDLKLWRRMFSLAGPHKRWVFGVIAMMSLTAGVDVIMPLFNRYAVNQFIENGAISGLPLFAALYALCVVLQGVNVAAFVALAGHIENYITYDLRKAAFSHLQQLSFSYYDKTAVGYLMARMSSDTSRVGETIGWSLVDVIWAVAFAAGSMISMLTLNWKLALLALAVLPPLGAIAYYFQKRILAQQRIARKANSRITGAFNEGISGAKTSKTLVREQANLEEFRGLTGQLRRAAVKSAILSSLFSPIVMLLASVATGFALWQGGAGVMAGTVDFGTLVAFISYTSMFFEPVVQLARLFADFQSSQAAGERVFTLLDARPEIVDSPEIVAKYGDAFSPKRENWEALHGDIEFENVSFHYNGGEEVLSDFSLNVRQGQTIALVGETGSGKSTIVNLLCRFYEPTEGRILIDGKDYRERSQLWLHLNLGYVLQAPHLFSGTVKDNIRYANAQAPLEDVERAARLVGAHEFIMKLEKGYDTDVGEGGNRLSTGEKQLISFARALLADPRIFVLDEATSSIDTETEQKIQNAINKVLSGRTSFIIAHRLSTIRNADRILVIRDGRMVENGSHRQLMQKRGYYYQLYTNQFKREREEELLNIEDKKSAAPCG